MEPLHAQFMGLFGVNRMMRKGKIHRRSVEYNLTEHCNLRCRGCGHASPIFPEKFASLAAFHADLEALAEVFHSDELRIVGGEPLLHPQLLDFLREARRIGIADRIVLYTNGVLLHGASAELWQSVDEIYLSVYPGVRRRLDESECERLCRENGVKLTIYRAAHFEQMTVNNRIEDGELVQAIYDNCKQRAETSCHTAYEGRFYKCPVAAFTKARLARSGIAFPEQESDWVDLHDEANLERQLETYLTSTSPLTACSFCLGDSGPTFKHEQLNRVGLQHWMEEDNSMEIEHTRKSLLQQT
jgi:MoaA/NifB/PqqE/SkfB family radical SAM enzyme